MRPVTTAMPRKEPWHKSSYSQAETNCVEAALMTAGSAGIRDTQNRHLGHLEFSAVEWAAFLVQVKSCDL
ncbi:DUF397 domain-containing protein [Marinactinospora rubrisoli]|uniref:DUF397 domain-containing protein n=1 Tax=Marinactinospora rubrisoli TaxID=2715399 RepID=A0ABW2KET3_9ACTN